MGLIADFCRKIQKEKFQPFNQFQLVKGNIFTPRMKQSCSIKLPETKMELEILKCFNCFRDIFYKFKDLFTEI